MAETALNDSIGTILGAAYNRYLHMEFTDKQKIASAPAIAAAFAKASPADRKAIVEFTEANSKRSTLTEDTYWFLLNYKIGTRTINAGFAKAAPGIPADDFRASIGLERLEKAKKAPPKPLRRIK